ncbi:site-2 protease family protein [Thiomicrospira cyclica]|jgi:Zn-dependent protease|uniref:Peptidase M50 n=1 Tax=Thiomicrospira cyclica (strain DSM 14477 / JCM 11371 / ALM1) TaxID=717773 RepID=F6DCC8_THICA|nr:site-2 protease family protein [Thiomicrospira cyclica]AEG31514.1 peptidase M50 [Thiomicrospira cyclica ALM1]
MMAMHELNFMQLLAIWALPVIFAITLHEAAHGWAAEKLGDKTARMLGRVTLNPIKHIDPIGTLLVPAVLLFLGGFIFGWAKAVPVSVRNFKKPERDMAVVAIAGPAANLLMAVLWALILKLGFILVGNQPEVGQFLIYSGIAGLSINIILMLLNLLPIPPLDGSRLVSAVLPKPLAWQYNRLEPFGLFILLGLVVLGVVSWLLSGPYQATYRFMLGLIGV